jgi:hypothetical protein
MRIRFKAPEKAARSVTLLAIAALFTWGVVSVTAEVRPFWVDEWRIIYNLKFKTIEGLWGKLAYMQQFPRTYLSILKTITSWFDYNYYSLRIPSFLIGVATMGSLFGLAQKLYPRENYNRFLLVLMLVSCGTFTEYFVQIKQYTMDLFLCTVVLWQLYYLLQRLVVGSIGGYLLLCISFLLAPFFSYTYPLVAAPVYGVLLLQHIQYWKTPVATPHKIRVILRQWLPLFFCTFSITVFYMVDVRQLTADRDMSFYWGHLMMNNGFDLFIFFRNIFHMFAQAGSGLLFWWLFGLLCSAAFLYNSVDLIRSRLFNEADTGSAFLTYSLLLMLLIFVLHGAGKLPIGEPRLNAFLIPATAMLLIRLLGYLGSTKRTAQFSAVVSVLLYAGLTGNIFTTIAASFTDSKYARRMQVYRATDKALRTATSEKIPVLITPGVAYPYENTVNFPYDGTVPGDWVFMTFPGYRVGAGVDVFAIQDTNDIMKQINQLPGNVKMAMVGDGLNYRIVKRKE